jgi:glutamate racemase
LTGIFDSGVGGLAAYFELRRLLPREDIIYLADRKNAPYGTKTKDELIALTKKDIKRLCDMGARQVLIACCTASTVYSELSEWERKIATPIISPASRVAAEGERIAVIATEHTVRSGAFGREIRKFSQASEVFERAEQALVAMVESGSRDGRISDECEGEIRQIAEWVTDIRADTLVLGCTHFSHLESTLREMLPCVKIVSPAREGARAIKKKITVQHATGNGREIYI